MQRIYRIKTKLKTFLNGRKITDDFDWDLYHEHYRGEMSDASKKYIQILSHDDYIFENKKLVINKKILPLHPNWRLLYETILRLEPSSVIEIGCGGGYHLKNLNILCPQIKLYGVDISSNQINLLRKRHPNLDDRVKQLDITLPYPLNFPIVDIAFTQAVIMHMHTGNSHMVALSNLFRCASKQVILMENWKRHDFMGDIEYLISQKMISWEKVYLHYCESPEWEKPHMMVVSSEPLKDYKILTNYAILRDNVK